MNSQKKTAFWIAGFLLAAASGFGAANGKPDGKSCVKQPCSRPACPSKPCCEPGPGAPNLMPAYNHPAPVQLVCGWDVWTDASFTYWQASQDNMEFGISDSQTQAQIDAVDTIVNGEVINQKFGFKPGFKIGGGMQYSYDNWDTAVEYTWFRGTNHKTEDAPSTEGSEIGFIYPLMGATALQAASGTFTTPRYSSASSKWTCNLDLVDALLGRWYYVGTKLTFHPVVGMRAAFIRQKLSNQYINSSEISSTDASEIDYVRTYLMQQNLNSWAVGFKTGLDMSWMLGEGIRLYGCGSGDILYTRYRQAKTVESSATTDAGVTTTLPFNNRQSGLGCLRPHLDLELGFGWSTYLDCNKWYLDCSAGYDFQVFFDQNMFRRYGDEVMVGNSVTAAGNLYLQGLNIQFALHY